MYLGAVKLQNENVNNEVSFLMRRKYQFSKKYPLTAT
jgi:hypothetical protein